MKRNDLYRARVEKLSNGVISNEYIPASNSMGAENMIINTGESNLAQ